jgi:hypothetical protein
MISLKRYFVNKVDESDSADDDRQVALGPGVSEHDGEIDDEAIEAFAYLNSVRSEASRLPFAVEAIVQNMEAPTIDFRRDSDTVFNHLAEPLCSSVLEYFTSLRSFVCKDTTDTQPREIKFDEGMSESHTTGADYTSISTALELLAEKAQTMDHEIVVEYLWALLVQLDFPLLEDTAAGLQSLRKYCDSRSEDKRCTVCSIIISRYFRQP